MVSAASTQAYDELFGKNISLYDNINNNPDKRGLFFNLTGSKREKHISIPVIMNILHVGIEKDVCVLCCQSTSLQNDL